MDASGFFHYSDGASMADETVFLRGWTERDWSVLVGYCERRRFFSGETVIVEGGTDMSLLIVLDGTLASVVRSGRRQRTLPVATAGGVFGEISFLDGPPHACSVLAETDGELLRLDFTSFEALNRARPDLGGTILLDLGRILAGRLRRFSDVYSPIRS